MLFAPPSRVCFSSLQEFVDSGKCFEKKFLMFYDGLTAKRGYIADKEF